MMRVAIDGNIGSGKTEVIRALARDLGGGVRVFEEPVQDWTELLPLFYASPSEWGLAFSLKVLLGFRQVPTDPHDFCQACVVERSPLTNRHVFAQLLYNDGSLTQQEWDLFKEYHDVLGWSPDAVVFIDTPTNVCMHRIQERGRVGEAQVTEEYLRRVEFQYENMLRFLNVPVVRVDGTLDPAEVYTRVRQALDGFLSRGV